MFSGIITISIIYGAGCDVMKGLLIAIMIMGALMIISYFIAAITKNPKHKIIFSAFLLLLIALLIITWIYSIITHQHAIILLVLAIIFIILHRLA